MSTDTWYSPFYTVDSAKIHEGEQMWSWIMVNHYTKELILLAHQWATGYLFLPIF